MTVSKLLDALARIPGGIKIIARGDNAMVATRYHPMLAGRGRTMGEAAVELAKAIVGGYFCSKEIQQAVREHEDYMTQLTGRP